MKKLPMSEEKVLQKNYCSRPPKNEKESPAPREQNIKKLGLTKDFCTVLHAIHQRVHVR